MINSSVGREGRAETGRSTSRRREPHSATTEALPGAPRIAAAGELRASARGAGRSLNHELRKEDFADRPGGKERRHRIEHFLLDGVPTGDVAQLVGRLLPEERQDAVAHLGIAILHALFDRAVAKLEGGGRHEEPPAAAFRWIENQVLD